MDRNVRPSRLTSAPATVVFEFAYFVLLQPTVLVVFRWNGSGKGR